MVIERKVAVKEDAKVTSSTCGLDNCVSVNVECRTIKLRQLSRVAEY
mgnify:FL=1